MRVSRCCTTGSALEGDHVGLAHSTDGGRWEKYNYLTTQGVLEESDPVSVQIRTVTSMLAVSRWGDW
jgi:hypothetical protein